MANGGDYAAYDNLPDKHYKEGFEDSFDLFHDDVTAAYVKCMTAGQVPTGTPTDPATLKTLSEELGDAVHKFFLSAIIDTEVTVPAMGPSSAGHGVAGVDPIGPTAIADAAMLEDPITLELAGPDMGPIEKQGGIGMGHLE